MPDHGQKHLAVELTEAATEAVQVRLLLAALQANIPAKELVAFLAVVHRALDLEIRLLQLASDHPIQAGVAGTVVAKPRVTPIH